MTKKWCAIGGQEGPVAEGAELAVSRNVRETMDPSMGLENTIATLLYAYKVVGYSYKGKDGIVLLEKFPCLGSA